MNKYHCRGCLLEYDNIPDCDYCFECFDPEQKSELETKLEEDQDE